MDATMKIAVVLTAFDKMSSVVDSATEQAQKKLRGLMSTNFIAGSAMIETGLGIAKSMAPAVSAYSKLEDANTDLKSSMLDASGAVDANFSKIASLAESLGDKLPGATADFDDLFKTMMENGVKSTNILNGVGKAAAYLAVDVKMPYAAAGEFAARMKEATGVADDDLMKFFDTISRAKSMGLGIDELRYAFAKSSGTLKGMGLQGLQASNSMTVLYGTLIRAGMSGETAATSFNNIIASLLDKKKYSKFTEMGKDLGLSFNFFKNGKFLGVENMIAQFDKMKDLSTVKKAQLINALTGGGGDAQALSSIVNNGTAGYQRMRAEMEKKAALNDKVNLKLATLSQLWEATTGTIENMLAALGAGLAPVLKPIAEMIGIVAGKLKEFMIANPAVAKFIGMMVSLVGIAVTMMGVIKVISGIRYAFMLLNITMMANPFILIASLAILAISLIYANWDKIGPWFKNLWEKVKGFFVAAWDWIKNMFLNYTPTGLIIKHWDKIAAFFSGLWDKVKAIFMFHVNFVLGLGRTFFNAGINIVKSIWEGIKSMADKPYEAIKKMVGKIRNLLPFSPAKDGPLRDIHRIRLVETIADSIRPAALVNKMRNVAQLSFNAIARPASTLAVAPVGGGGITVHMHNEISLNGSASQRDADVITSAMEKKFEQLMKKYNNQKSRVKF